MFMFELRLSDGSKYCQQGFISRYFAEVAVEDFRDFIEDRGIGISSVLIREEDKE